MLAIDRLFGRSEPAVLVVPDLIAVHRDARREDPVTRGEATRVVYGRHAG